MKLSRLVGDRYKERPADCAVDSQALMTRGGYMKYVANGLFSSYTPLRRVMRNIERIIREEMDTAGGQEVLFPVVLPASLWRESGRYDSVGGELLRFRDRNDNPMVLGMTHEEAAVHLVREYGQSYAKYPFMIYQIQTKFRDELRPRGGLLRVREFSMKDAYSFHTSASCLSDFFYRCRDAYERIFARVGIPQVVPVASDSGMMGGSLSYEFMLPSSAGEDTFASCPLCGYRANREAAECVVANPRDEAEAELIKTATPGMKTIADVCGYLNVPVHKSVKAVVYQTAADQETIIIYIRGDLDVNETKLMNLVGCDIHPAGIDLTGDIVEGYIGPYHQRPDIRSFFDASLSGAQNLCCGANEPGYHYTGFNFSRDIPIPPFHDLANAYDGGMCPQCRRESLQMIRGIEVGHIFQLGDKYTQAMSMRYTDEDGQLRYPLMGCYGIGIGRLAAAICEVCRTPYGPLWPAAIAPWQVHLCCIRADDDPVKEAADELYQAFLRHNTEVIYDDRPVSAGVMFSDADLLGVPVRVIVSPRNVQNGVCEVVTVDKTLRKNVPLDQAVWEACAMFNDLIERRISA